MAIANEAVATFEEKSLVLVDSRFIKLKHHKDAKDVVTITLRDAGKKIGYTNQILCIRVRKNDEDSCKASVVSDEGWYIKQEERRPRKLLLNKNEIKRLGKESKIPGITIVPIRMFINDRGLCKVEIALCKGKKEYDKRESIKEKDNKRNLDRVMKNFN
jgi:hypothetical protein